MWLTKAELINYSYHETCSGRINLGASDGIDSLPPRKQICDNTFEAVLVSPSPPELISQETKKEKTPQSSNEDMVLLFYNSEVARVTGDAELSMHAAHQEFQLEASLLDNENIRRRLSVIPNRIEFTFNEIRRKLSSASSQEICANQSVKTDVSHRKDYDIIQAAHNSSEKEHIKEKGIQIVRTGSCPTG